MRKLSNAIITDWEWKILVVDKEKENWDVLTILPWWKIEEWENLNIALFREIDEEIWISNILIRKKIWVVIWKSPSWKDSEVNLFKVELWHDNFHTANEVKNPRYLTPEQIYNLETTTELTKSIIDVISFKTFSVMKRKRNNF